MGPRLSAGRIMRPAVSAITPTSSTAKVGPSVRNVPAEAGTIFFCAASRQSEAGEHGHEAAEQRGHGAEGLREGGGAVAGKGAAVVVGLRGVGVERLGETVRPRVEDRGQPCRRGDRHRRHDEHHGGHEERAQRGELDLARLDLLAEPFGCAADHQAGDEDRDQDVEEHADQSPVPTPPKTTSPTKRLTRGTAPPIGVWASMPLFTEPFEDRVAATVQKVVVGDAEPYFLVGHVAATLAGARRQVDAGACAARQACCSAVRSPRRR